MNRRLGGVVGAVGLLIVIVSAFAEPIGLGDGDGIGWLQTFGIIIGAVLVIAGLMYARRGESRPVQPHA